MALYRNKMINTIYILLYARQQMNDSNISTKYNVHAIHSYNILY